MPEQVPIVKIDDDETKHETDCPDCGGNITVEMHRWAVEMKDHCPWCGQNLKVVRDV